MKQSQQQTISNLLSQMFKPETFSTEYALLKLNQCGGIFCLINYLTAHHRQGLSTCNDFDQRKRVQEFGRNCAPYEESMLKKSLLQQRDFMINFLFYLLTLRICVQALLWRDEIRGISPLGVDTVFKLNIWEEVVSYILLICMILLRAYVSVQYFKMDQDERKYKNDKINVKRDGETQRIFESQLLVGDILLVQPHQSVKIDGIVLEHKNLIVSEAHTILRQDTKTKTSIFLYSNQSGNKNDPFVLAGSYIISGSGQILVCTVGEQCTFRIDKQNKGYYHEYTPMIAEIKKIMNKVESTAKVLSLLISTFISVKYAYEKIIEENAMISWIDLLYVLKIYCSFIGLICFIQRLKIIKSLQFFIETFKSGKQYRIRNRSTLQKLSNLQILFIESETLGMHRLEVRGQQRIQLNNISTISQLNNYCQIKIITKDKRQKVQEIFGSDIHSHCFYEPNEDAPYSNQVRSLVQSVFLTDTSSSTFVNEYLPIYKALGYEVGYLYDSDMKVQVPSEVLQINFQRLNMNITSQSTTTTSNPVNNDFWVKLQNKLFMEDVLQTLFERSKMYSSLLITYMSLFVNNILVFLVLCHFSANVELIDLSWYLVIIIVHRYLFFMVYRRMTQYQKITMVKKSTVIEVIKFNLFLFPYYFFVAERIQFVSSMFLFFIVNAMVRIEVILWVKTTIPMKQRIRAFGAYLGTYLLAVSVIVVFDWNNSLLIEEILNNVKLTFGLIVIYVVYGAFL